MTADGHARNTAGPGPRRRAGPLRSTCGSGFTLLEVLLACALLAVVGAAAFSWIASQGRASRAAQARLAALEAAMAVARLLDDDLSLAVPGAAARRWALVDEHTLAVTTLARHPGEEPGAHAVTWRFEPATGRLLRGLAADGSEVVPAPRLVSARLAALTFHVAPQGGLSARLRLAGGDEPEFELRLWSEGR